LINTTEKQTKLWNDMYINQMKINKLNKGALVLKEDMMIVKSYKNRSSQSRRCFIYCILPSYKKERCVETIYQFRKTKEEIKQNATG
jgi:hypothetical protein